MAYAFQLAPVTSPLEGEVGLRHPKSAMADFGGYVGQVGNIRLGMRASREGGIGACRNAYPPPHPSPSRGEGGDRGTHSVKFGEWSRQP